MKRVTKNLSIKLTYLVDKEDPSRGYYPGGVEDPAFLEELGVWVNKAEKFSEESDSLVESEGYQIHIQGSRRALFELGRYLIALSQYHTSDPSYHDHLEDFSKIEGYEPCEVIIHGPPG